MSMVETVGICCVELLDKPSHMCFPPLSPEWEQSLPPAALQPSPDLHPERVRLLAVDCWTRDPAVAALIEAARGLIPIAERLRDLCTRRPSVDRLIADEIGALVWETIETGRINICQREPRVSGVVGAIWIELESLRARWIAARLQSEGLSPAARDFGPWYDRLQALEEEAPGVAVLWSNGPAA
jgi:hypothetical protein